MPIAPACYRDGGDLRYRTTPIQRPLFQVIPSRQGPSPAEFSGRFALALLPGA